MPLKPISAPKVVGKNVVVELHIEEYKKGVEQLMFSFIGKLFVPRRDPIPTTIEIKARNL